MYIELIEDELTYTRAQANQIAIEQKQVWTYCKNELNGEDNDEYDTYQVSHEGEDDYYGEWINDHETDSFYFRFYKP